MSSFHCLTVTYCELTTARLRRLPLQSSFSTNSSTPSYMTLATILIFVHHVQHIVLIMKYSAAAGQTNAKTSAQTHSQHRARVLQMTAVTVVVVFTAFSTHKTSLTSITSTHFDSLNAHYSIIFASFQPSSLSFSVLCLSAFRFLQLSCLLCWYICVCVRESAQCSVISREAVTVV